MPIDKTTNDREEANELEESQEEFVLPELDHKALNIQLLTLKKAYQFLEYFSQNANVQLSARLANISRVTVYKLRRECPEFAEAWDRACEYAVDDIIGIPHEIAKDEEVSAKDRLMASMFIINRYDKKQEKSKGSKAEALEKFLNFIDEMKE
jgi:hypothetical protein